MCIWCRDHCFWCREFRGLREHNGHRFCWRHWPIVTGKPWRPPSHPQEPS